MTIPDRTLRRWLAGASEPPEHEAVAAALANSPELRERLQVLLGTSAVLPDRPVWFVPPPAREVERAAVMGTAVYGAWVVLRVPRDPSRDDHVVVLLERRGEAWEVAFPVSAGEVTRFRELPSDARERRIDVDLAQMDAGRVAVLLVPPSMPLDWSADALARWAPVREAVADGELVPVAFTV